MTTAPQPAWTNGPHRHVYLASQSPRRQQLLAQIGVPFELLLADAAEDAEALEAVLPRELPAAYVMRVARLKLAAARVRRERANLAEAPILCADTTVALGRQILGKPVDAADAAAALQRLSGRTHRVYTAVAVAKGRHDLTALSRSEVRFGRWSEAAIEAYVAGGEPFGKAGSYAIQGTAAAWVRRVSGSYSGIMGLPLYETARLLVRAGVQAGAGMRRRD